MDNLKHLSASGQLFVLEKETLQLYQKITVSEKQKQKEKKKYIIIVIYLQKGPEMSFHLK